MTIDLNTLVWEDLPCEWCFSPDSEIIVEGPDWQTGFPGKFTFVRCKNCGLYRQNPRLTWKSLEPYYDVSYHSYDTTIFNENNWLKRLDKRYGPWKRLKAVEKYKPGGNMLEVGCGTGGFLEEALKSGRWNVTGVEPVEHAAKYTSGKLGVLVYCDLFGNVNFNDETFDAVIMWNVLEHLDHPVDDLKKAWQVLRPRGVLVCSIPNLNSLEALIFGRFWVGWELPRHLFVFPIDTLQKILSELGFTWLETRCVSTTYGTLGTTLSFWANSWKARFPRLAKTLLAVYWSLPMRILLIAPLWLMDHLKKSTVITVFVRKPEKTL